MRLTNSNHSSDLYLWADVAAVFFSNSITPYHCHNTLQIVFDLRRGFKCKTQNSPWSKYNNLIIKENVFHKLDSRGSLLLILYLDAKSDRAKMLNERMLSGKEIFESEINLHNSPILKKVQKAILVPDDVHFKMVIDELLFTLNSGKCSTVTDPRIKALYEFLARNHTQKSTVELLAQQVFLSKSSLRSLFKEQTGLPLHRFIIWNNVQHAITLLMNGSSVKDAAIETGFVDTSHFNKTLTSMFGITPSAFVKTKHEYKAVSFSNQSLYLKTVVK